MITLEQAEMVLTRADMDVLHAHHENMADSRSGLKSRPSHAAQLRVQAIRAKASRIMTQESRS